VFRFICGCTSKIVPPIDEEVLSTFDSVTKDEEGFLICLVHRERLYGWRSVPYTAAQVDFPGMGSMTPLEYERWRIFGELPRNHYLREAENAT